VITLTGPADPPVSHTYTVAGTFTALITATDKDGATSAPSSFTITASPAPVVPIEPPATRPSRAVRGAGLVRTGASTALTLSMGFLLVCCGLIIVALGRRRTARLQ
jgi:hypothetical protein